MKIKAICLLVVLCIGVAYAMAVHVQRVHIRQEWNGSYNLAWNHYQEAATAKDAAESEFAPRLRVLNSDLHALEVQVDRTLLSRHDFESYKGFDQARSRLAYCQGALVGYRYPLNEQKPAALRNTLERQIEHCLTSRSIS